MEWPWKKDGSFDHGKNLKLAVGAHFGPVVGGNIGSQSRLEFAVLGDTVNVASRLESATREIGCNCLASASLIEAAKAEGRYSATAYAARLTHHGPIRLRGRSQEIDVYRI